MAHACVEKSWLAYLAVFRYGGWWSDATVPGAELRAAAAGADVDARFAGADVGSTGAGAHAFLSHARVFHLLFSYRFLLLRA